MIKGVKGVFKGYLIHVRASHAAKAGYLLIRILGNNIIAHTALGQDKKS